jgi:hypothetical protein
MLRIPGLSSAAALPFLYFMAGAALLALAGCDLFSTREFRPKPSEIRVLPGLAKIGDSVSFRAIEAVWLSGAEAPEKVLSRRRLTFAFEKDSLAGGDTLKLLALTVREDSSGILVEQGRRLVRFGSQGVSLSGGESGGGARWFPLKAAAAGNPIDTGSFPALPALLIEGWGETAFLGILTVKREQTSVDTLAYRGHSEEAWGISETVFDGSRTLATGRYWYGASGLLKAQQTWEYFGWRGDNGAPPAKSGSVANQPVSLRRSLERL